MSDPTGEGRPLTEREPEPVYPRHWGPSMGTEEGDVWLCEYGCPACGPVDETDLDWWENRGGPA